MNAEYVWWLVLLVAVGIGVVTYLALGPVPEIPGATDDDAAAAAGTAPADGSIAGSHAHRETAAGDPTAAGPSAITANDDQSSPVSTTEPGPSDPSSTSDTP